MQKTIDHPCKSILRDRRWSDDKRWFAEARADSVDGPQETWTANQSGLKAAFAREVEEGDADEHGKDALAREEEHEDTGEEEYGAEGVFQDMAEDFKHWVVVFHPCARHAGVEIIGGKPDENNRDGDQRGDEARPRGGGEPEEHLARGGFAEDRNECIHDAMLRA
jgi:hypothetical protein